MGFEHGGSYALDRMSECHGDQGWSRVTRKYATATDGGRYDSRDGVGRVESGTETESNAWSTTPGKEEVELRREQQSSCRDVQELPDPNADQWAGWV